MPIDPRTDAEAVEGRDALTGMPVSERKASIWKARADEALLDERADVRAIGADIYALLAETTALRAALAEARAALAADAPEGTA